MLEPDELKTGLRVRGLVDAREVTIVVGAPEGPRGPALSGDGQNGHPVHGSFSI